jgi:uncharacterized protein YceK
MKKLIALFTLVFLLSGCVGVITLYPDSTTYRAPFAPGTQYTDSAGTLRSAKISTQEDFLREWGEPTCKEADGMNESWTYYRGKEMCGVVLGLIIPIPLILPVCTAEDHITFQGGTATSITIVRPTDWGVMCGLFVNGLHGGSDFCSK